MEGERFKFNTSAGYRIKSGSGYRDARTPSNVLYRAIEYAAAQGFRLIWVDQDCIGQEDIEKKEQSIQAMHLMSPSAADRRLVQQSNHRAETPQRFQCHQGE